MQGSGRLFLTEWIRKYFIDEGAFELDLEEDRFKHEKMEGREFHVREQSERTLESGENGALNQERTCLFCLG